MTYETIVRRRVHDKTLAAETEILLDEATKRWLHISTGKVTGAGIKCTASVCVHDGTSRIHAIGFGTPGGDFWRTVEHDRAGRATEKNIRAMHDRALARIEEILALARAHYRLAEKVEA